MGMELNLHRSVRPVPVVGWRIKTNLRDSTGRWEGREGGSKGGERRKRKERKEGRFGVQSKCSNN